MIRLGNIKVTRKQVESRGFKASSILAQAV
jgi:hypothetical protein